MKVLSLILGLLVSFGALADLEQSSKCVEVKLAGVKVACFKHGVGPLTPSQRAEAIRQNLETLSENPNFDADKIMVVNQTDYSEILAEDTYIAIVRNIDLDDEAKLSREELARDISTKMKSAINANRALKSPSQILWGIGYTVIAILILGAILSLLKKVYPKIYTFIENNEGSFFKSIKINSFEILNSKRIVGVLLWLAQASRFVISAFVFYIFVSSVLSFFPWTAPWAPKLYGYIIDPIFHILGVMTDYIPNMFFVLAIGFVSHYLLKFVHVLFHEVEIGNLEINGFYKEWADPTYKLVRVLVIAFALVMAFPYLPGSNSPAFQGISVFLGILLSLGSSSAISNIVAGVVLTYMRPFKVGDRVKISDNQGDVIEKNLLITRIRSIKNVEITIPNSMVLGSHIINYSSTAASEGLVLNTTITIGYDVPWRKVHELLKEAAKRTELIAQDKEPFILQTALNDFSVSYELNAYTNIPNKMAVIYSGLHQNIQDCFNEAGVEIMSPHYSTLRDGNEVTIPVEYRAADYSAPKFRVDNK